MKKGLVLLTCLLTGFSMMVMAGEGYEVKKMSAAEIGEALPELIAKFKNKGWMGVELKQLDDMEGTYFSAIKRVVPDSPAQAAGFQEGDILVAINDVVLKEENKEALHGIKKEMKIGANVTYTVKREGSKKQVAVTLAQAPDEVIAQWVGHFVLEHFDPDQEHVN